MRRATKDVAESIAAEIISIHALHEESDVTLFCASIAAVRISIHALHEESDNG